MGPKRLTGRPLPRASAGVRATASTAIDGSAPRKVVGYFQSGVTMGTRLSQLDPWR